MAFYTFQARFDGGDWENWTGNFSVEEYSIDELKHWYEKHWGRDSKNIDRLMSCHRIVQFRLLKSNSGRGAKKKTIAIFPEIIKFKEG